MHMVYICSLFAYTFNVYVDPGSTYTKMVLNWIQLGFVVIPFLYECAQIRMAGPQDYFTDVGNLIDITFIGCSIAMCVINNSDFHAKEDIPNLDVSYPYKTQFF